MNNQQQRGCASSKTYYLLGLALLLLPVPAFAATPAALIGPVSLTPGLSRIGIAAAVSGTVEIVRTGQVGRIAGSGDAIFLGDEVATDDSGTLQILLLDQTVFTIGPNSAVVIDEFVYDPATDAGRLKARITRGVFRFVTGKIARKNPSDMEVRLPIGTIGVRGTIVAGEVTGTQSFVALMGPGEKNNAGKPPGSFVLKNEIGGKSAETLVYRTGYAAEIIGIGSAPSRAFQAAPERLQQLTGQLLVPTGPRAASPKKSGAQAVDDTDDASSDDADKAPPPHDGQAPQLSQGGSRSGAELAGQDTAGSIIPVQDAELFSRYTEKGLLKAQQAALQAASVLDVVNGVATFADLRNITTGAFSFQGQGFNLLDGVSSVGSYNIRYDVDFAGEIGGLGAAGARLVGTINAKAFRFNFTNISFGPDGGFAIFEYDDLPDQSGTCSGCIADAIIRVNNDNGTIAKFIEHEVTVVDGGTTGVAAERLTAERIKLSRQGRPGTPGRSAAWLARLVRDQEVQGSNPCIPTNF